MNINNPMLNDANTGWLYQIGDQIFGHILLIGKDNILPSCKTYSKSTRVETASSLIEMLDTHNFTKNYDCIIYDAIDNPIPNLRLLKKFNSVLSENGVVAVFSNNPTSLKNITDITYSFLVIKKSILFITDVIQRFTHSGTGYYRENKYLQSFSSSVSNVLYKSGYQTSRNPFNMKEKALMTFVGKYTYPFFCSNKLNLYYKNKDNNSVLTTIIKMVEVELNKNFIDINFCNIIPYKTLVSVTDSYGGRFLFLLLRGADKNIRANKELDMLNSLNENQPTISKYISKNIASGIYKNIEFIVYKELNGMTIDKLFSGYSTVEKNAYNILFLLGDETKQSHKVDKILFAQLTEEWCSVLYENNKPSDPFMNFMNDLNKKLYSLLNGNTVNLLLFHGDFKIENVLFEPNDLHVTGIIDWDLSCYQHLPGLDLLYLIVYSRRIKELSTFKNICSNIFCGNGFTDKESKMLSDYFEYFGIPMKLHKLIFILFILHHFSFRERNEFSEEWFMGTVDCIWDI